ncbi:hypothetical protein NIM87_01050 [Devosia sp. XJ19-1]|uniref:DUF3311 domain-containing protein n=1 Tax=Devosia ureilytica TaxID=2952754 RepID=A0A9Q4ALW7_9HYPH|nr:hypothetical protein [Devosia ureilytica]MCP8882083.1 hypothetical protein [Devosia ureilytica]MCP8886031.1 hypothetical protein [Devosia ureilytica]
MTDRRKLESGVLVFAVFSALLIVPPLVYIFNHPILHFGLPQIVLYLFGVWLLMVAGTAVLTHYLPHAEGDSHDGSE